MKNKITPFQYAVSLYRAVSDGSGIEKKIKNFLGILADNNDLKKVGGIIGEFEKYDKKQRGVKDIEIISAKPLTAEVKKQIVGLMGKPEDLEVQETVNPDLLAGLVVISGDMMIDGSLRKKLRELNKVLS